MSRAYSEQERKEAWAVLYERFNVVPAPEKEVWKIQADLTAAREGTHKVVKEAAESAERMRAEFEVAMDRAKARIEALEQDCEVWRKAGVEQLAQKEALEKELKTARMHIALAFREEGITPQWLQEAAEILLESPHEAK